MTFESLMLYGVGLPFVILVWIGCMAFAADILIATFANKPEQQAANLAAKRLFASIWSWMFG